jgi:hypothetical protein
VGGGREADRAGADHRDRQLAVGHVKHSRETLKDFNTTGAYQLFSI